MGEKLTYMEIQSLQKQFGADDLQRRVDDGSIWKWEGSTGRWAMDMLQVGVVMLPKVRTYDYYGNTIPSRLEIKTGTKGSFQRCEEFWRGVKNGDIEKIDALHETFNK